MKVTNSIDEHLLAELMEEAREEGVPLSRFVANAAEQALRHRVGKRVLDEWHAEHGAFLLEELAAARPEIAPRADRFTFLLSSSVKSGGMREGRSC